MKLFLCSQRDNLGYDTYSDFVACCDNEDEARVMHPDKEVPKYPDISHIADDDYDNPAFYDYYQWPSLWTTPDKVTVTLIGEADPSVSRGVVIASFHAG